MPVRKRQKVQKMLRQVNHGVIMGACRFDDSLLRENSSKRHLLPENPRSVIAVLFPYHVGGLGGRNVARYACLDDYHKIAGEILAEMVSNLESIHPGGRFTAFVDASPIREVVSAHRGGLGVIGRHGLLIHDIYGSRVFIGTIVTTLEMPYGEPKPEDCLGCNRCVSACPTGALFNEGPFNKARCLSYITQKKGVLTDWEHAELKAGGMAWGCDICSDACPLDQGAPLTEIGAFYHNITPVLSRKNIDAVMRDKPYGWRGKDVILRNLSILEE